MRTPGTAAAEGRSPTWDPDLELGLDTNLPATLPAGSATSVFIFGSCFHRRFRLRDLDVLVDDVPHAVVASRMPRLDVWRAAAKASKRLPEAQRDADRPGAGYRSGFWAIVPVRMPATRGGLRLRVRVTLSDRSHREVALGTIAVAQPPVRGREDVLGAGLRVGRGGAAAGDDGAATGAGPARVAIAMATFDPDPELFRAQIDSIRAQTIDDWICVISDDCTPPVNLAEIQATLQADERFVLSRAPRRLGFYKNFERALGMIPPGARLIALADHDDRWYPEKLETLIANLGDAGLVYSDQRVVDRDGRTLAESYWGSGRCNNHTNLASLLIANTITGAASLFRRELLEIALPFPDPPGEQYHDHWLGAVALATGKIAYVDRPLYDYVQHEGAALGHLAANVGPRRSTRKLLGRLRRRQWGRNLLGWKAAYFFASLRLRVLAEVILVRGGDQLAPRPRRTLRLLAHNDRSPRAFGWLALRPARRFFGRTETLGAERLLLQGALWPHAIRLGSFGRRRPRAGVAYDASPPVTLGRAGGAPPEPSEPAPDS